MHLSLSGKKLTKYAKARKPSSQRISRRLLSLRVFALIIRELQSFISYLIFGNRSCPQIARTTGSDQFNLVNLIYSGKGICTVKSHSLFHLLG